LLFFWIGQWLEHDLAGKPGPTFPDHAQKPGIRRANDAQKGSPAKRTGHTLLIAAQYSQKSPKNNVKPDLSEQNSLAFPAL
jgi:hypothetical protein